jgi:hypothetical protein
MYKREHHWWLRSVGEHLPTYISNAAPGTAAAAHDARHHTGKERTQNIRTPNLLRAAQLYPVVQLNGL